jgi:hypothetical protein
MPLLRRKSVFAAKIESTVGTAETITSSEGVFNARDFSIQPSIAMTRREGQGGFNYLPSIPEGMMGTCTITHDLAYDGTNLPTWASVLLPACGWVDTAGVFSPVTQGPGGAGGVKTLTIAQYLDGKRKMLSGAMGTFTITLPTGKVAFITFTFTGLYHVDETDTAIIAPTYPTTLPLRFANGSTLFDSVAMCLANATVDAGNSVQMRECVEAGNRTGYESAIVTDRAPIITADPESVLVATQNRDNLWLTSDPGPLAITLNGTGNSTLVIAAPAAQLENKQQAERNGMSTDDLTWLCSRGSAADTELTITFNAAS